MSQFSEIIQQIRTDIESHNRDRKTILYDSINERLGQSLRTYYAELSQGMSYLQDRDPYNLTRKLNKVDEQNDKLD